MFLAATFIGWIGGRCSLYA